MSGKSVPPRRKRRSRRRARLRRRACCSGLLDELVDKLVGGVVVGLRLLVRRLAVRRELRAASGDQDVADASEEPSNLVGEVVVLTGCSAKLTARGENCQVAPVGLPPFPEFRRRRVASASDSAEQAKAAAVIADLRFRLNGLDMAVDEAGGATVRGR